MVQPLVLAPLGLYQYICIECIPYSFVFLHRFGVCCVFTVTESGQPITQNCTYIRNPGFPSAYSGTSPVSYTINKCSSGVYFQLFSIFVKTKSIFQMFVGYVWISSLLPYKVLEIQKN